MPWIAFLALLAIAMLIASVARLEWNFRRGAGARRPSARRLQQLKPSRSGRDIVATR